MTNTQLSHGQTDFTRIAIRHESVSPACSPIDAERPMKGKVALRAVRVVSTLGLTLGRVFLGGQHVPQAVALCTVCTIINPILN